jgi:predicted metal-dependent hydrolase
MPFYTIGKTNISYKLERREDIKRRYIEVTPHQVLVTVHTEDTSGEIDRFLKRKERWLFDNTSGVKEAYAKRHTVHRFTTGIKIPYRGRRVSLKVMRKKSPSVEVIYKNGLHIAVPDYIKPSEQDFVIEDALRLWLKKQMRKDVGTLLRHYSEKHALIAKGFRVKEQKHMWGSCGKDGTINLNWHLIFAPKAVLEYAVVHELCHLKHRTHGPAFWRFLKSVLPEYEKSKAWLEKNEQLLGYELNSDK